LVGLIVQNSLERLTFTFPVLESAKDTWLIAAGPEKAQALSQALQASADRTAIPAQ
jgi:6-phosphogluconolactonase